jgi:hypothetical protein
MKGADMCFSATASFIGGAVISAIGVATIRKNKEPSQRLFAAIPLLFGIQQVSEGFVWLTLQTPGHDMVLKVSAYIFITMAVVVWPTLLPLSLLLMERSKKRRGALYAFLFMGIIVSLSYLTGMLLYKISAGINSYHILYLIEYPHQIGKAALFSYLIATLPPLFISSRPRVYLLGIIIVLSYIVTYVFYREFLISVWCIFAALASIIIWWSVSVRRA